jgi:hypothetical protein
VVPFDDAADEIPYEERAVLNEAVFADFPRHVELCLRGWELEPLLPALWAQVKRRAERTRLLGERLAAGRRALERAWGCHNLEVPVSRICRTEPFAWFACHLLAELPRFHALHNASLKDYRRLYGIRSRSHPVPDLTSEDDWLEAPFWAWRSERPRRQRLMVRLRPDATELRAGGEPWPSLPFFPGADGNAAVRGWQDLERRGFKIRSRALSNTLYARLFLGDLFIHGIGGAKYDELNDEIARRFYGLEPPAYVVLSATRRLPLPTLPVHSIDCRRLAMLLHDIHCNPQRHLESAGVSDSQAIAMANQKQSLIERRPGTARERRERYRALQALTVQLRSYLADYEQRVRQDLARCDHQLQINAVLQRRDYAFCLFPEETLRPFCRQFL